MPTFDLGTLINITLSMNAVGIAELFSICAAIPAFIVAATPTSLGLNPKHRNTVLITLAVITFALQLFVTDLLGWVPVLGALIGLLIRWHEWVRQHWLLLAFLSALALGVVQFSGLQYGHARCAP